MLITSLLQKITRHVGSHSVTCHAAAVTFLPSPPAKAGNQFSDPRGMQGCVSVGCDPPKMVPYLSNNWAVSWLRIKPAES